MAEPINVTIRLNRDVKEKVELNRRISPIEADKNLTAHELIEVEDK